MARVSEKVLFAIATRYGILKGYYKLPPRFCHPIPPRKRCPLFELTLEDLLPHRPPSLYITEVLAVDETSAEVRCRVESWWPLQGEGGVQALLCVELAAQASGVCNGLERIRSRGLDSNKSGWLVAVKKADFGVAWLPLGRDVLVRVETSASFHNLREVACELSMDGERLATIILQLYQA